MKKNMPSWLLKGSLVALLLALTMGTLLGCEKDKKPSGGKKPDKEQPTSTGDAESKPEEEEVVIAEDGLQVYEDENISCHIPLGYKVESTKDYEHFALRIYDPEKKDSQIVICLKLEDLLKSTEAKDSYIALYGEDSYYGQMPVLTEHTSLEFYEKFTEVAKLHNPYDEGITYPLMNEFTLIQNFGESLYGGDVLNASYLDDENNKVEGLFTVRIVDNNIYKIGNVDVASLSAYYMIFMTAPEEEFMNLEESFKTCISTLSFTEDFVDNYYDKEDDLLFGLEANQPMFTQFAANLNLAWESRDLTYDIASQKFFDAINGYVRVVDVSTKEIYRATQEWWSDYQKKVAGGADVTYTEVEDDEDYAKVVAGYLTLD